MKYDEYIRQRLRTKLIRNLKLNPDFDFNSVHFDIKEILDVDIRTFTLECIIFEMYLATACFRAYVCFMSELSFFRPPASE